MARIRTRLLVYVFLSLAAIFSTFIFLSKIQGRNYFPFPTLTPAGAHDDIPDMRITRDAFMSDVQHMTTTHYDGQKDKHNNSVRAKTKQQSTLQRNAKKKNNLCSSRPDKYMLVLAC
jgi:hypothetical protein